MLGHDIESIIPAENPFPARGRIATWSAFFDAVLKVLCFADPWVPACPIELARSNTSPSRRPTAMIEA
jgi:hypothetical protein